MALNDREAFKLGFLLRCAEAGASPNETIRQADELLKRASLGETVKSVAGPLASAVTNMGLLTAVGVPVGLGVAGGYAAHKVTDTPVDENDIKQNEIADEYHRLARVARLNAKLRSLRSRAGQL
jgi:pyruvoyl-dependent arginine decarboxylase (PvlArgDC)